MLKYLNTNTNDKVVEFSPEMSYTACLCLPQSPTTTAIEQNVKAAAIERVYLNGQSQTCRVGNALNTGIDNVVATVVYGEAMHSDTRKNEIIAEAEHILATGTLCHP